MKRNQHWPRVPMSRHKRTNLLCPHDHVRRRLRHSPVRQCDDRCQSYLPANLHKLHRWKTKRGRKRRPTRAKTMKATMTKQCRPETQVNRNISSSLKKFHRQYENHRPLFIQLVFLINIECVCINRTVS